MNKTEKNFSVFSRKDSKIFASEYFLKKIKDNYDVINGFNLSPLKNPINKDLSFVDQEQRDNSFLLSQKNNSKNFLQENNLTNNQIRFVDNTQSSKPFPTFPNFSNKQTTINDSSNIISDDLGNDVSFDFLNDDYLGMNISDFLIDDDPFLNYLNKNPINNNIVQNYKNESRKIYENDETDYLDFDCNDESIENGNLNTLLNSSKNDSLSNLLSSYDVGNNIYPNSYENDLDDFVFLTRAQIKDIVTEKLGYTDEKMVDDLHSKSIFENWKELDLQKWLLNPENIEIYKNLDFKNSHQNHDISTQNFYNKKESPNTLQDESASVMQNGNNNSNNSNTNFDNSLNGIWNLYSRFFYDMKQFETYQKNNDLILKMEAKQNNFESEVQRNFASISNEIKELSSKVKSSIVEESYKTLLINNQTEVLKNYFNEKLSSICPQTYSKEFRKQNETINLDNQKLDDISLKISEINKFISNMFVNNENSKNKIVVDNLETIKNEIKNFNEKLNSISINNTKTNNEIDIHENKEDFAKGFINRFNKEFGNSSINKDELSLESKKDFSNVLTTKQNLKLIKDQISKKTSIDNNEILVLNDYKYSNKNKLDSFIGVNNLIWNDKENDIKEKKDKTINEVLSLKNKDLLNIDKQNFFIGVNNLVWNNENISDDKKENKINDILYLKRESLLNLENQNFFVGVNQLELKTSNDDDQNIEKIILSNKDLMYFDKSNLSPGVKQIAWKEIDKNPIEKKTVEKNLNKFENRFRSLDIKSNAKENFVNSISETDLKEYQNNSNFLYKNPDDFVFDFIEKTDFKKNDDSEKNIIRKVIVDKKSEVKQSDNPFNLFTNELALSTNEIKVNDIDKELGFVKNNIVKKNSDVIPFQNNSLDIIKSVETKREKPKLLNNEKDSLKNEIINYNETLEESNLDESEESISERIKRETLEGNEKKIEDFKNNVLLELDDIINNLNDLNIKDDSIYDIENLKTKFKNI